MAKTKVPGGYIDDGSITSSHLHSSHGITTNDIGEHTNNKYYTDARVDARLAASKSANLFTTGNIEIGSDTGKLRLGTGADLRLYHNGTNSFIDNFTGDLVIQQGVDDADIILKTDDGSGGTTAYLTLDGSAGHTYVHKALVLGNDTTFKIGGNSALQFSHNGSNTFIGNNVGILYLTQNVDDGVIHLRNDDGSGGVTNYITLHGSTGEVRLSHYGNIKLKTQSDGIDVTGHIDATTLTTTGNVAVGGNLTVTGTTTTVNTVTMNAQNAVVFEGATADAHETTLTIIDPTADRTINLPNQSGTIPVLAAASNTAITATPAELNYVDGVTSNIQTQLDAKQATISSSTDLTLSSIVTSSSNETRLKSLFVGADTDVYLYESATNAFSIRTGTSGAYKYFTFAADGKLNLASDGLQIGGTEVISGGRNLSNIGTGTFNGAVTMNSTLNVASTIGIAGTTVIDGSRNLTNIGTIGSGAITSSGLLTIGSGAGAIKINESFITARSSDNVNDINLIANINVYDADDVVIGSTSGQRFNDNIVFRTNGSQALRLDSSQNAIFGGVVGIGGTSTNSNYGIWLQNNKWYATQYSSSHDVVRMNANTAGQLDIYNQTDSAFAVIRTGGINIGSTQVIDGSRNLTNIGTVSSGAITTSGNIILSSGNKVIFGGDDTYNAHLQYTDNGSGDHFLSIKTEHNDTITERIKVHAQTGVITFNGAYTFPTSDGSANQVLQTDGSGALSFATVSSGGSGFSTITEPSAGQIKIGAQSGANEGGEILLENAAANGGGSYTTNIHLDNYQNQFRVHAAGSVLFSTATGTGNTTVGGTLTSGDIFIEDSVTPKLTLKDTGNAGGGAATAKIVFANTAGDAIGIGYTSNIQSDSDLIISTNAGGTYGGYLGLAANGITDAQSDIILEPKTNVRIATGQLLAEGTASNSVPKYSFEGDANTGLGYIGADQVGLIVGGSRVFYVAAGSSKAFFQNLSNGVDIANGLNISSGALQVGSTTVIDSSRVLQNVTANTSILTAGTLAEARLPATARRDQTGSTANYGPWYGTGTFIYDATNGTRYYWLLIGTIAASSSRGMIEYEVKDDENYPMGLRGSLFYSGFNSGTSFSVQHDVTTAYASNHEPQVRLDTSRRIWMRFPSNDWASYMRFRVHKQGGNFTTNTSWSTGTTRYDTAGSPSAPANASSDILPGQNLRATSSSVTGTVPTYAHAFTSDRIKARKGFFGGKISVGSGQTDVNGTYDLYNNGTSYFNGAVTIDDNLTITNGAITGSGSGLTNLNASNISSGTIDSDRLATGASGNWWAGNVVKVRTDGVMEAGKYIDFHNTDTSTADYDVRLQVHSTNNLSIQGSGRIFHDGYHPNADTLTTARTIAGTSFNGSANIDISYNNLTNKPTIPTNNNQLTNGAGYITSADGGNAQTLDGINSTSFARVDAGNDYTNYANNNHFYSNTNMATSSGNQASLECFSNGSGNDAFMTFHVGGDFACYFGLDGGTNKLSVGGWSMGANSYEIYHSGNKPSLSTLGFTGASNANYITNNNQLTNGAGYITSSGTAANATQAGGLSVHSGRNNEANKIVRTDANGYIQAGWINTTSGSTTTAMDRIYASNDGYIRYYTPINFLNSGGFGDHLFNNQAQSHSSSTNFNTSMSAGVHYMQQGTNGPTGTGSHQFYGVKFGLGSDYSSSSAYSSQMYYPRAGQGGGNGLYFRDMENGSWGSWRQVDAGTVTGFAPSAGSSAIGASQLLRSHTNNYIYTNWINVGVYGIYSGTNGAHFYPNTLGSYGTWRINGTRGGYSGIMMDGGGDVVTGMFDGSGNGGDWNNSSGWHYYYHRSNDCLGVSASTTSSSYGLYVTGAIYATADIVGSSDERLKTEIKTIPNALDKVLKLRGVTYKWRDPEEGGTCVNNITETRMGVIAQEVVDVVPEVVTHDKENDRYGVSYGHLTGVLIEAVKELKQEVNELKKELEEVKNG